MILAPIHEFNPHHEPAGTPVGGQFARASGASVYTSVQLAADAARIRQNATTEAERKYADVLAEADLAYRDAVAGGDTKSQYTRADGTYTPERLKVHAEIIRTIFENHQALYGALPQMGLEHPVVTFMGGMPGAGKSMMAAGLQQANVIRIDPDEIKAYLPEYDHGKNANGVARESGDIGDQLMTYAAQKRMNIIVDGTMKTSGTPQPTYGDGLLGKLAAFKDDGYRTEVRFVDVTIDQSVTRTIERYVENPRTARFIPLPFVRSLADPKYGTLPRKSFELAKAATLRGKPLIDAWYHVNGWNHQPVGSSGTLQGVSTK